MILFLAAVFLLRADRRKSEVVVSTFLQARGIYGPSDAGVFANRWNSEECSRKAAQLRGNALCVTREIAPPANQTLFG